MNVKRAHVYRISDGTFTGDSFASSDALPVPQLEEGVALWVGDVHDWRTERIDTKTGKLVPYVPRAPDENHEWNARRRRWHLKPEAAEALTRREAALAEIRDQEAKQARALRELVLAPGDESARARLAEIDRKIAEARARLT